MKKDKKKSSSGFTLIELLLYITLLSVMMFISVSFFSTLLDSRIKNQTVTEVEQQGLGVIQIINQTLRNATSVISPQIGTISSSLSIAMNIVTTTPTIFKISSSTLQIIEGSSSPINLTNNRVLISNLSFYNLSSSNTPGIIRTQFTITHVNSSGKNVYDYQKTFYTSAALRYP